MLLLVKLDMIKHAYLFHRDASIWLAGGSSEGFVNRKDLSPGFWGITKKRFKNSFFQHQLSRLQDSSVYISHAANVINSMAAAVANFISGICCRRAFEVENISWVLVTAKVMPADGSTNAVQ